jgi:hypothetical protein
MKERMDYTDSQIKKLSSLEKNRFIGRLIEAKIIERLPHNNHTCYFFLDPALNFALINAKKEGNCDNHDLQEGSEEIPF